MKRDLLGAIAVWLSGCVGAPAIPPRSSKPVEQASTPLPDKQAETPQAERPSPIGTFDAPAEPFSASWVEPAWDALPPVPIDSWVNSDACPDPLEEAGDLGEPAYRAFIDRALGLGTSGELAVLRIHPSFTPARSLSVVWRPTGSYVIRSSRLTTNVWAQMMQAMRDLQGKSIRLDDASEAAALSRVTTSRVIHESEIDKSTAWLIIELWRSVTARAQPVVEIGTMTGKFDGTTYELREGGRGSRTHSPADDTVLGDLVSAAEHLEKVSDGTSTDREAELRLARELMRSSLDRTRKNEPCLRRVPS